MGPLRRRKNSRTMTAFSRLLCCLILFVTLLIPPSVNGQAARQKGRIGASILAKDPIAIKLLKVENQSEEKLDKVREPAQKFAHVLFQ